MLPPLVERFGGMLYDPDFRTRLVEKGTGAIDSFLDSLGGLAGLLSAGGRYQEAVALMRRTLVIEPGCEPCWIRLIVALYASGDTTGAREAAERASSLGIELDPELLRRVARERGGTD